MENGSTITAMITGAATVAADAGLTLLTVNETFRAFFGHAPAAAKGGSLASLLPYDKAARLRILLASDREECEWKESLESNGTLVPLTLCLARISGMKHAGNQVYHLVFTDVSELLEIRRSTAFERLKYDIIADLTEDIPFEYDFATDTMSYAEKFVSIFHQNHIIPHFRERLRNGETIDAISTFFRSSFLEMTVSPDNAPECQTMTTNGRRWFSLFCTRLMDSHGLPIKAVGAIRDIDRQKCEQLRLLDKSRIDAMTGLLNKATAEEEIRKALVDMRPDSISALLMIDLDNFKTVNDTMGHLAGDAVLSQLARQLSRTFRGEDIIGRVGGDEFHVFMRDIRSLDAILEKTQEICSDVRKLFAGNEQCQSVSISVGVTSVTEPTPYAEVFRQADVALYQAKVRGKNRYEFFGSAMRHGDEDQRGAQTSPIATRIARNSIVVDILDTLFSAPDTRRGIDKALDFIGPALGIDAILLYEKSLDLKTISVTHAWAAKAEWRSHDIGFALPVEDVRLPLPRTLGGIYYCSDVQALPEHERTFTKDPAVTSFLQCDIARDNVVIGVISFEERGSKRIWTQQEIDALTLMSKLISANILQTRSASLLRRSTEATRNILDSLPGAFVCVISRNRTILYCNSKIAEIFPQAREGMTCFELFKNRATPCEDCPRNVDQDMSTCFLSREMFFGKKMRVSVSDILWENRESAYVALLSEYVATPEERAQQKKKEAYAHALCETYEYVMDINCATGTYELLALAENSSPALLPNGEYDGVIDILAEKHIFADDKEAFRNRFYLQSMLQAFGSGSFSVEMEYSWLHQGYIRWKHRLALPYTLDDGSSHILTYVSDITEQKEKDLRAREEEANYLLALQGNYSEIFRIDLTNLKLFPLYYNKGQDLAESTDFNELRTIRATRVHPEFVHAFLDFCDPAHVRACMERGETIEVEYKKRQKEGEGFRWIINTIRPVPGSPSNALMLLRDVTLIREEEAVFHTALKSSYDGIYEVDLEADSIQQLSTSGTRGIPLLTSSFTQNTLTLGAQRIHPDDLDRFLEEYRPENLCQRLSLGKKSALEYRTLAHDGQYRWFFSLVLPLGEQPFRKLLILTQDITARKHMERENRKLEQRYTAVFRQSCDVLVEADLETGAFSRTIFSDHITLPPAHPLYGDALEELLAIAHPDDRERILQTRSLEALRHAFNSGETGNSFQYRIRKGDVYLWLESRVFFVHHEGSPSLFLLARDISNLKRAEEERNLEAQRFSLALRAAYTEIYELDIDTEVSRLVFSAASKLIPVGTGSLVDNAAIISQTLHPDDREHVTASFRGSHLHACFEQGMPEVTEEFRRLDHNGGYRWVSAVVVPLREGNTISCKAMMLVKDITQHKAEEQRQRLNDQYFLALRNIYDQVYEFNATKNTYRLVHHVSGKYALPPETGSLNELVSQPEFNFIHPEDKERLFHFFNATAARHGKEENTEHHIGDFRTLRLDGTFHWVSITMLPASVEEDEIHLVFFMDIDAGKQAEELARQNAMLERQRLADERYRIIVEQTNTLVFEWRREDDGFYLSPELPRRFAGNYDDKRDIMRVWNDGKVVHPDDMPVFTEFLRHMASNEHSEMTIRLRKRNDDYIWCKVVLACLLDEKGLLCRHIGTLNDVDEATRSEAALQYRAEYDTLTGVYNTSSFYSRSKQLFQAHPEQPWFIIRMDIDRFKVINDLYGMAEGDLLLKKMAQMLDARIAGRGICGRLSGDVFCACVDFSRDEIIAFVREITDELAKYPLASRIAPSFGICGVDNIDTPINVLCDWANLALKTIKGNVLIYYAFYDGTLRKHILEEKKIETEMHGALRQGQFTLYLQPKVHIPSSTIVGAEGLIRWSHPVEGLIPPDRFIPLFEKNGFIINLDEYVWEQTCKILHDWRNRGFKPLPVSVNVSRMHIHDTRLYEKLTTLIAQYDIDPHLLELELTENVFLDSDQRLISIIQNLQRRGFILSLDDFGAGYSSLNMLKSLPIDTIKIDRGFLGEIVATERGKIVIRHTIALARAMNMEVIAEGVETRAQADFLMDAQCSLAQGYYYSPPVPVEDFERMAFGTIACWPLKSS